MDVYHLLGKRIRELRAATGLSQARLADIVNTSAEFLSRIERGKAAPSIATAGRIAAGLGVDIKALFDFADEEKVDLGKARADRIAHVVVGADEAVSALLEVLVIEASQKLRGKES